MTVLALVVADDTSLTTDETWLKDRAEALGFTVTVYDDGDAEVTTGLDGHLVTTAADFRINGKWLSDFSGAPRSAATSRNVTKANKWGIRTGSSGASGQTTASVYYLDGATHFAWTGESTSSTVTVSATTVTHDEVPASSLLTGGTALVQLGSADTAMLVWVLADGSTLHANTSGSSPLTNDSAGWLFNGSYANGNTAFQQYADDFLNWLCNVSATGDATVAPGAISAATTVAGVAAAGSGVVTTPEAIVASTALSGPATAGDADVAPAPVVTTTAISAATTTSGEASPDAIATTTSVAATASAGGDGVVAPTALTTTASLAGTATGDAVAGPAVATASTTLSSTESADASVVPAAVATSTSVAGVAAGGGDAATSPAAISTTASMPTPGAVGGLSSSTSPSAITTTASISAAAAGGTGASTTPGPISTGVVVGAPAATADASVTAAALTVSTLIDALAVGAHPVLTPTSVTITDKNELTTSVAGANQLTATVLDKNELAAQQQVVPAL